MKDWRDLTRRDLIDIAHRMSGIEIAREYNIYPWAVYQRMKHLGIKTNGKRKRFNPPKKELEALYRKMSMAKIAEHYGVGETVVWKRLKDHGIGGISTSDRLTGVPKSLEHRLNMSRSALASGVRAGSKNGNWKGGKSSAGKRARSKAAYHEWKASVLANADWKCQRCGREHGDVCECCGARTHLHAHHIVPFSENASLRYEPSNGEALCNRCHQAEHDKQTA